MKKNLRISIVTETYFPQVNGVSRTLDRLVRYCLEQGDRIQLLLPSYANAPAKLPANLEKSEWKAISLPFYKEVVLPLVSPSSIEKVLAEFRPDLVHIATEGPLGYSALRATQKLGLPVVSSYHTNFTQYLDNYRMGFLIPLGWRYLRSFHNATLATYCPTATIRSRLETRGFRNVAVWSRGVDSRHFHPEKLDHKTRTDLGLQQGDLLMTYTGRLANEKNLGMLIRAWSELTEFKHCYLLLIGDGPLRKQFEAQAPERVLFAGYRYGEELAKLYASSDLFVFPSLSETFGNVILEAMASGVPAVGFDVQGPADIIQDGLSGNLVKEVSSQAFATALRELIRNPNRLHQMSIHARRYAEEQTWEAVMGGLRARYQSFIGKELNRSNTARTKVPLAENINCPSNQT